MIVNTLISPYCKELSGHTHACMHIFNLRCIQLTFCAINDCIILLSNPGPLLSLHVVHSPHQFHSHHPPLAIHSSHSTHPSQFFPSVKVFSAAGGSLHARHLSLAYIYPWPTSIPGLPSTPSTPGLHIPLAYHPRRQSLAYHLNHQHLVAPVQ